MSNENGKQSQDRQLNGAGIACENGVCDSRVSNIMK